MGLVQKKSNENSFSLSFWKRLGTWERLPGAATPVVLLASAATPGEFG
jgi:hypothetical protein